MIVDSHCHLDYPQFTEDFEGVTARARAAGIETMVTISTKIAEFDRVLAVAERADNIFCSVGTHPHNATPEKDIPADEIVALAAHPKVVAIGEAGLDYHYDNSARDDQAAGFRTHIEAARRTGLPLVIHTRDADDDTAAILADEMQKGAFPAVLHCFTAGRALAEKGIELGLYVSFSGVLTFRKSDELRAIAHDLPLDRILVETDAPFLAPEPNRGKSNEPAFVAHTARKLAEVRGMSLEEIAKATSDNFYRLFSKAARPLPAQGA